MSDNYTCLWENVSAIDNGNGTESCLNLSSQSRDSHFDCSIDGPGIVTNVVLAVLYSLVCVAGIFGNSLVIFVVIKFRWNFLKNKKISI